MLEFIRRRGAVVAADLRAEYGFVKSNARYHINKLLEAKQIVEAGQRERATVYRPVDAMPTPRVGAGAVESRQEPALEGRLLSLLCHKYLTPAQLAAELEVPATDVDQLLAKLLADGDIDRLPDGRYRGNE